MTTTGGGAYYNENDPYAAAWLRNLIAANLIAPGHVDERSIVDVQASDLQGFTQWHLFAGIAGWSLALRLAGWPDDRPVLTASVPCQPFSAAGSRKGHKDDRNLWPHAFRLISELRPPQCFGEQVEAAIGFGWLDRVFADLEGTGYACAAVDLPACSVGAPHIRQRIFWVADAEERPARHIVSGRGGQRTDQEELEGRVFRGCGSTLGLAESHEQRLQAGAGAGREESEWARSGGERVADAEGAATGPGYDLRPRESDSCRHGGLGDADRGRREEQRLAEHDGQQGAFGRELVGHGDDGRLDGALGLADADGWIAGDGGLQRSGEHGQQSQDSRSDPWRDAIWLLCLDGKARRVEPGIHPLAHGVPNRVGRLRAYGNAIVPQVAAEFVKAFMETR